MLLKKIGSVELNILTIFDPNNGAMNRISEVLKQKGIKQADVAKGLGVGKSTISMYCSNSMQPSLSRLIKLAELLNCEIGDLLVVKR